MQDCNDITKTYNEVKIDNTKENIVTIEDFELNKNNVITQTVDTVSQEYQNYANWASENNIGIVGILKNNTSISTSFKTYQQRNEIIADLYDKVVKKQYRGIMINFEKIDDINSFNRFIIELAPKFKEAGLKIIIKSNGTLDNKKLENIVDSII